MLGGSSQAGRQARVPIRRRGRRAPRRSAPAPRMPAGGVSGHSTSRSTPVGRPIPWRWWGWS